MELISFIIPSRTNLKYLKQAYRSIRKNSPHPHEICIADDASTDGTKEWVQEIMKEDENVKFHINEGPDRLGLTILYDLLERLGMKDIHRYDWEETEHSKFDDHSQAYMPHMDKENGTLISLNVEWIK